MNNSLEKSRTLFANHAKLLFQQAVELSSKLDTALDAHCVANMALSAGTRLYDILRMKEQEAKSMIPELEGDYRMIIQIAKLSQDIIKQYAFDKEVEVEKLH